MSLISTFYAGDATAITQALNNRRTIQNSSDIRQIDFSGGIQTPFLFPDDFRALIQDDGKSFWILEQTNLLEGDEHGMYHIPKLELDRLISLSDARLRQFSDDWNRHQAEKTMANRKRNSIWKNKAYWTIMAGGILGLGFTCIQNRDLLSLNMLASWLLAGLLLAVYVSWRRSSVKPRPLAATDWVPKLKQLQEFMRNAREHDISVYYHWSL